MARFLDADNREWILRLTVGSIAAVKERTSVLLGDMVKGGFNLGDEPENLVRVLWVLCEKQADKLGITPEDFGYAFDGPAIAAAGDAIKEALIDFFQRPAVATEMKAKLPEAMRKMEQQAIKEMRAKLDSILNESAGD